MAAWWHPWLQISSSPFPNVFEDLETANHILLDYMFARQVWFRVLSPPSWAALSPPWQLVPELVAILQGLLT
uniref:Uncharacterized protein n=1 Tax=Oryza sativa subsp. japonica TaxID=39947 RepID=Q69PB2_ORYSJ|nr:hypothetical protein [Oryza sativa Japonica Group]